MFDDFEDDEPERVRECEPLDPQQPFLSFAQIATVIGVSPDGARKIHDRALAKLRYGLATIAKGPVEQWAFDEL